MKFDVDFDVPIVVQEDNISDKAVYYEQHHRSNLIFTVLDQERNLVARGVGMNWSQTQQMSADPEWGKQRVIEIVEGSMLAGQLSFQSMNFFHLNDSLPSTPKDMNSSYLTCIVQVANNEAIKPSARGLVIDVFQGVKIQGQSGSWNATSKYLRNGQMIFLERLTGLQWLQKNADLATAAEDGSRAAYPYEIK
jgi:hypothetical protein